MAYSYMRTCLWLTIFTQTFFNLASAELDPAKADKLNNYITVRVTEDLGRFQRLTVVLRDLIYKPLNGTSQFTIEKIWLLATGLCRHMSTSIRRVPVKAG